jgi:hypothetical protein
VFGGTQPAADIEAGDARQHQVEDHQIGRVLASNLERLATAGGHIDGVPFGPQ